MQLALTLSLNDKLVGPLRRAVDEVEKHFRQVERGLQDAGRASQQATRQIALVGSNSASAAREVAGLARNTLNAASLADKLREAWSRAGNVVRGVVAATAGYEAAKFVLAEPMQKQRTYDRNLADSANVAFANESPDVRKERMRELDDAVINAVRIGGGSRDEALAALNDMLASGTMTIKQATDILPTVMKYATAGNAAPGAIATIAVKALQNDYQTSDITPILDKTLMSGLAGGFELKDVAKWIPSLMAMGKQAGLTGMRGYERILASAQAAVITAGTKDEAGTNLRDLLQHVSSHALQTSAKRMGIDAAGTLAKAMGDGDDTLTALVKLSDFVANRDPRYVALQKKLDEAGTKTDSRGRPVYSDEQKTIMQQQANLLQGSAIGNLFHNQQSILALVALRNNRKYVQDVLESVRAANGQVGQSNFDVISSTADFRLQQKSNEELFAQTRILGPANEAMGKLAKTTADLYQKYPGYSAAVEGAALAVQSMTAFAVAASGSLALLIVAARAAAVSGGVTAVAAASGAGAAVAGAGAAAAASASRWAPFLKGAGSLAGLSVLAGLFYTSPEEIETLKKAERARELNQGRVSVDQKPGFQSFEQNYDLRSNSLMQPPGGERAALAELVRLLLSESPTKRQEVDVRLSVDAPDFLSVQQIGDQVAREGRRQ